MAQLFSDNFTGTDGDEIRSRSGWLENGNTAQRNKFVISSNQMNAVGGGSRGYLVGYDTATDQHWVKATINSRSAATHTMYCRMTLVSPWSSGVASANHVYATLGTAGTFITVSSRVGGTGGTAYTINSGNSAASTFPINDGDTIEMRIDASGFLTMWKNSAGGSGGSALGSGLSMDMSGVPAGTYTGFMSDGTGLFDDFATGDFSASDGIGITSPAKVVNRGKGATTRSLAIAGTYTGTAPTHVEYRVTSSGVALSGLDWQTVSSESISGGTWSGVTGAIPQGGPYAVVVRYSNNTGLTATSSTFYVGVVALLYGQSNATRQVSATPTATITPAAGCYYRPDAGSFSQGNVAVQQFSNQLSSLLGGLPVALLCQGAGGTAITLLKPGNAVWDTGVEGAITAAGGDIEAFYMVHGESDVSTASATYKADLDTCYSRLKTITGRTAAQLAWLECQTGTNNAATYPDAVADPLWAGMRKTQADWVAATTGAYLAAKTTDLAHAPADDLHYSNDSYVILGNRVAQSYAYMLGAASIDGVGPVVSSATFNGSVITLSIGGGATSLSKASGAAAIGLQASSNNWSSLLTISDAQISGNTVQLTLSAPLADSVTPKVRHLWFADPDLSNLVTGTGFAFGDTGLGQLEATATYQTSIAPQRPSIGIRLGI